MRPPFLSPPAGTPSIHAHAGTCRACWAPKWRNEESWMKYDPRASLQYMLSWQRRKAWLVVLIAPQTFGGRGRAWPTTKVDAEEAMLPARASPTRQCVLSQRAADASRRKARDADPGLCKRQAVISFCRRQRPHKLRLGPAFTAAAHQAIAGTADELTGGRFTVTIMADLSGSGSRCGRHQLAVARCRCCGPHGRSRGDGRFLIVPETTSLGTRPAARSCLRAPLR
jgi:hypothetical protein